MTHHALEQSAKTLLASVITDGEWRRGLEGVMAQMDVLGGGIARIVHPRMYAVPTSGVAETFQQVRDGKAPTLTSQTSMRPKPEDGFMADHIAIPEEVRKRDIFYQEFLRPKGCIYKTAAFLDASHHGTVDLLIYRNQRQGPFQGEELDRLKVLLPHLRAAAMVARGNLSSEARRQAEPFERRGEPVLYLGFDGEIIEMNAAAESAREHVFRVVDRRAATLLPADQRRLDQAVTCALSAGKPGLVTVSCVTGHGEAMALVVPVLGRARDVFKAVSALMVFLETGRRHLPAPESSLVLLREAAGLTGREMDVVRSIAGGSTPQQAAAHHGISLGTARLHLKAAFAKLGVHSQAELTMLVNRLG